MQDHTPLNDAGNDREDKGPSPAQKQQDNVRAVIEALLFSSDKPLMIGDFPFEAFRAKKLVGLHKVAGFFTE